MDELKQALEGVLFLIEEYIPSDCLNIDEGDGGGAYSHKIIERARQVLSAHMTEAEKENSPIFTPSPDKSP